MSNLSLIDARNLPDTAIKKLPNLKQLSLTGCDGISSQTLKEAPLASLTTLILEGKATKSYLQYWPCTSQKYRQHNKKQTGNIK